MYHYLWPINWEISIEIIAKLVLKSMHLKLFFSSKPSIFICALYFFSLLIEYRNKRPAYPTVLYVFWNLLFAQCFETYSSFSWPHFVSFQHIRNTWYLLMSEDEKYELAFLGSRIIFKRWNHLHESNCYIIT